METKHTPTPWKSNSMEIFTDAGKSSKRIAFATGKAQGDDNELAELKATAAFIVRACNAHDELVAALERLLGRPCPAGWMGKAAMREADAAEAQAIAALAKARGEA